MHNSIFSLFWAILLVVCSCSGAEEAPTETAEERTPITDQMLGQLIMQGFRGMEGDSVRPVLEEQLASLV